VIDLQKTLVLLARNEIEVVIVGGVAASAHGSSYATFDLDLCYARNDTNLARLLSALVPFNPRLRGAPADLPFIWDATTLRNGLNFTLATDLGDLDLLGEIAGLGGFDQVRAESVMIPLFGIECAVLSLDGLIRAKRAGGRPKDLLILRELEAIREATRER
jgi:hypothetical protein